MEVKGIKLEILLKADCASRRDSRYADKEAKDQQRLLAVVPVQPNVDSVVVHDDGGQRLPVPTYAPNNTFLPFASERPLTPADDESLNSLYALPADTVIHVYGARYALTLGIDVVQPLAPGQFLGSPALTSRFGLLQHYLCSHQRDSTVLVLSTDVWTIFKRDCASLRKRKMQEHIDLVRAHLRDFNMDAAHILRAFIPIHTGSHWKALFLQVDSSAAYQAGSIWDLDSLKYAAQDRSMYRQLCTDLYTLLRPNGTARIRTADKLCKHHPYLTALPCVQSFDGRPLQENGFDCGVFMASNVESMALRGTLEFKQADMESLRSQFKLQFAMFCSPPTQVRRARSHLSKQFPHCQQYLLPAHSRDQLHSAPNGTVRRPRYISLVMHPHMHPHHTPILGLAQRGVPGSSELSFIHTCIHTLYPF